MHRDPHDATRGNVTRPGHAGAHPGAAFVESSLAGAERLVAGDLIWQGPAVVAAKDKQRVTTQAFLVDRRDDPADGVVEGRDHAGVNLPDARQIPIGRAV